MKPFRWSEEKNETLKSGRGVAFESIAAAIGSGGLLDILEHPNQTRYPGQRILVVDCGNYVFWSHLLKNRITSFSRQSSQAARRRGII